MFYNLTICKVKRKFWYLWLDVNLVSTFQNGLQLSLNWFIGGVFFFQKKPLFFQDIRKKVEENERNQNWVEFRETRASNKKQLII